MATLCRLDVFLLFTFLNIISNSRYKVRDDNNIILIDSVGNESEGETARFYVLKKRK